MVALMRASMKEFARAQRSTGAKVDVGPPRAEDAAAADAAERLANELAQFPAPPFTSQRLCELLLAPREYYTKIEKLVRFSGPPRAGTRTDAPAPVRRLPLVSPKDHRRKNRREPNLPPLQSQVHAVEKLMTVTGTVASSNAPPDEPDDVDVNPARVRHEKDPVNLEQTAFVSSLVGTATGPGPGGDHPVATNGVGARVDADGTSTETDAGDAGPGPIGDANGSIVGSVLAGKRKAEGDPCSADGGVDGVAVDGGVAGPAVDAGGAPSVSAVES